MLFNKLRSIVVYTFVSENKFLFLFGLCHRYPSLNIMWMGINLILIMKCQQIYNFNFMILSNCKIVIFIYLLGAYKISVLATFRIIFSFNEFIHC